MKSFAERSRLLIGLTGTAVVIAIVLAGLNYQKLPLVNQRKDYSAYFADVAGLHTNAFVEVSGYPVGKVTGIKLDGPGVLVTFKVDKYIHLGDRTAAAVRTRALLGSEIVDVTPEGGGQLAGPIPIDRTVSPYQLGDTLGDLASTISGLKTDQLSDSLATLAQTFSDTPADLRNAVQGLARFGQTLDKRDAQLRNLLDNAAKVSGVLGKRTDEVVSLVKDTNTLLAQLRTQTAALDQIAGNISAVSQQRMSRVPWNFGGGPVSIRLRSPDHCARRVRQIRRSRVPGLLAVWTGAGDRSPGGTACRPRPSRPRTSAVPSVRRASA